MNERELNHSVGWLGMSLTAQRNNIAKLLERLKGVGLRAGASLSLHSKFLKILEQVANDREKELGILNEIEDVEKQHAYMRQQRKLKTANDARPVPKSDDILTPTPSTNAEEGNRKLGLWVWLALWWMLTARFRKNQHTPTPS